MTRLPRKARFYRSYCMYDAQPPGTGDDRWFMAKITSPEEWNIHIQIHSAADSPGFEAELRVGLQGASSYHATRISINGNLLVEEDGPTIGNGIHSWFVFSPEWESWIATFPPYS